MFPKQVMTKFGDEDSGNNIEDEDEIDLKVEPDDLRELEMLTQQKLVIH